jgi:hypothetical protein
MEDGDLRVEVVSSDGHSSDMAKARSLPIGRKVTINVKADPARRKRFEALVAELRQDKKKEASGFDAYWEAVAEVLDHQLYIDGGYETFEAFLADVVKVKKRTATRLMRVAKYASPADEAKYGPALLDAALGYIEATTGGPAQAKLPVAFDRLRIPLTRNGKKVRLRLAEVTVAEVNRARLELLRPKKPTAAPEESALRAAFAKDKALAEVDVRVVAGNIRLGPIPLGLASALAKALARAKIDSR